MTTSRTSLVLSAAVLAVSGLVQAQTPASPVDPQREKVERADAVLRELQGAQITDPTVFVKSAALGELTQIELAKLAQKKSQDANVRSFAARMLQGHEAIRAQLAAVARRQRLDVPSSLVYEDEQIVNEGAEKSGAEFDAWYAQQTVAEHQAAIGLFQRAAKMDDVALAEFAKKALPALTDYQRMAQALRP